MTDIRLRVWQFLPWTILSIILICNYRDTVISKRKMAENIAQQKLEVAANDRDLEIRKLWMKDIHTAWVDRWTKGFMKMYAEQNGHIMPDDKDLEAVMPRLPEGYLKPRDDLPVPDASD